MITAVEVLGKITERVKENTGIDVSFQHGNTLTVINYITKLREQRKVYPAIILFTEGLVETKNVFYYEFLIPKIAICTTTVENATEKQRLESNFKNIIYPLFESLSSELRSINVDYYLSINRSDVTYMGDIDKDSNVSKFNQQVDGCIIKNLKLKVDFDNWDCYKIK